MIDTRLKTLAVLPFIMIVTAALLTSLIDLEHLILKPDQLLVLNFSPSESGMEIEKPDDAVNTASLIQTNFFSPDTDGESVTSDFSSMTQDKSVEDVLLNKVNHNAKVYPKLSLVVMNGKRSFAILDDRLLHEGDSINRMTIQRIEKDRILIKDKTLKWIYMEEER